MLTLTWPYVEKKTLLKIDKSSTSFVYERSQKLAVFDVVNLSQYAIISHAHQSSSHLSKVV